VSGVSRWVSRFTYDSRVIPGVKRLDQSRPADGPFFAHYLFPISCNVACSSEVQVCRKAKSPWERRLDLLPRAKIYSNFKDTSFNASTLDVVSRVRKALPQIAATLPQDLQIKALFDQSVFVSSALDGVMREGIIAASLTAAMILLFLGSWRSTLVVATSIPLAICFSVLALHVIGQTINIMTLGGLALAVGILVDDATVEIENIHRNLAMGKSMIDAILDGAQGIATPAFVATLSICIVFAPIFLLGGVAYYLFAPLAMAVVFAMLASYFLSRTVVPTMVNFLLKNEYQKEDANELRSPHQNWFLRIHEGFNRGFEKLRSFYAARLEWALNHPRLVVGAMVSVVVLALVLVTPFLGEDFFPNVDAGQFRLHVSAPVGTRIEETLHVFYQVENVIRGVIPKDQIDLIIQNIGLPMNLNLALSDTATISSADGEIDVSLNPARRKFSVAANRVRMNWCNRRPEISCTCASERPREVARSRATSAAPIG
jgi:multidrug efflux pump subunit AcrB